MIEPESHKRLREEIAARVLGDRVLLDDLRTEARPLKAHTRRVQARSGASVSLVATDGGNNSLEFDPFLIQLIRVVDSSNNEHTLEVVTPTTRVSELDLQHLGEDGTPLTPLGELLHDLEVKSLSGLSPMIPSDHSNRPRSPSWVGVYRELAEWATLYAVIKKNSFGTDTLIVFDGLLRSKVFKGDLFNRYQQLMKKAIDRHYEVNRRRIYLVGLAKHSKVIARYRLAMKLEDVLTTSYPAYVEVPRELEENAYVWSEYARGDDSSFEGTEINKFVAGKMFLVKFGSSRHDPIWPIDIFLPQIGEADTILGYMLSDAIDGFPVPLYPRCLQKAHENAALVDFDFDVLQDEIYASLRDVLGDDRLALDVFRLQDGDVSQRRYG